MTEHAMYKMLLRVFIKVGVYAHTLAQMIMRVCLCVKCLVKKVMNTWQHTGT